MVLTWCFGSWDFRRCVGEVEGRWTCSRESSYVALIGWYREYWSDVWYVLLLIGMWCNGMYRVLVFRLSCWGDVGALMVWGAYGGAREKAGLDLCCPDKDVEWLVAALEKSARWVMVVRDNRYSAEIIINQYGNGCVMAGCTVTIKECASSLGALDIIITYLTPSPNAIILRGID